MPSIQVKNVPDDVHATLRRRAAVDGRTLQDYLLDLLRAEAGAPTLDEVLDRVEYRTGGRVGLTDAADAVRAEREAR